MGRILLHTPVASSHTYATWDPAAKGTNITLSTGNLQIHSSGLGQVRATIGLTSGKWYYEVLVNGTSSSNQVIGFVAGTFTASHYTGQDTTSWAYYAQSGSSEGGSVMHNGGGGVNSGLTNYTVSNIIGVAINADTGSVQFYKNGVSIGTPVTSLSGTIYPAEGSGGGDMAGLANFGASSFAYTVPTGYNAGVYT